MAVSNLRLYAADEAGSDGYPEEWHRSIKHAVREQAGFRCVRCHHPYRNGEQGNGEWSTCDALCTHGSPTKVIGPGANHVSVQAEPPWGPVHAGWCGNGERYPTVGQMLAEVPSILRVEARYRILTVHHLDGNKLNCRWWNLASLCQRCHLTVQGKVRMERVWPWEHTEWFRPYVAGFYAWSYLGEDLTREETEARLPELLALELAGSGA